MGFHCAETMSRTVSRWPSGPQLDLDDDTPSTTHCLCGAIRTRCPNWRRYGIDCQGIKEYDAKHDRMITDQGPYHSPEDYRGEHRSTHT